MKQALLTALTLLSMTLIPVSLTAGTAYAACPDQDHTAPGQVLHGIGQTGSQCDAGGVSNALRTVVEILSYIVGAAAVIAIIYSGFKYITAAGESGKVTNARNSLVYALVGLAVAAVAQFLVHFVLTNANNATPCPYDIAGHPDISSGNSLCKKP